MTTNSASSPERILALLPPRLVIFLLSFVGNTEDDALVTLQLAHLGDRLTLVSIGAVEGRDGRISVINPLFFDLIAASVRAAAELASNHQREFSQIIVRHLT